MTANPNSFFFYVGNRKTFKCTIAATVFTIHPEELTITDDIHLSNCHSII